VAPGIDRNRPTYGREWDLTVRADRARVAFLIRKVLKPLCVHVATPCTAWSIIGTRTPGPKDRALAAFSLEVLSHQDQQGLVAGHENPGTSKLWEVFKPLLGTPQEPKGNWRWTAMNGCSYGLTSPGVDETGWPMQKTFWLVTNRHMSFNNRCREGLVSPLTRSTVLSPDQVQTLAVGDVQADVDKACVVTEDWSSAPRSTRLGDLKGAGGFPVFFIKPGGQVEAEDDGAAENQTTDPGYVIDPRLEADSRAAHVRWMACARRGDWGSVKADLSVFEGLGVKVDPRAGPENADLVIAGLQIQDPAKRPHLTPADRAAAEEQVGVAAAEADECGGAGERGDRGGGLRDEIAALHWGEEGWRMKDESERPFDAESGAGRPCAPLRRTAPPSSFILLP